MTKLFKYASVISLLAGNLNNIMANNLALKALEWASSEHRGRWSREVRGLRRDAGIKKGDMVAVNKEVPHLIGVSNVQFIKQGIKKTTFKRERGRGDKLPMHNWHVRSLRKL